jgi:hypothetical protein
MHIRTLQLFLRSLVEPLGQCHAPVESLQDLRQAADLLGSLGDLTLAQFIESLRQAKHYKDAKDLAIPRYLRPVVSCYENVRSLKTRPDSGAMAHEDLVRELMGVPMDNLDKTDLAEIATELGIPLKQKAAKNDAIDAIWQNITKQGKPKQGKPNKATTTAGKAKPGVGIGEYAQKIIALKERANLPEVNRDEIEMALVDLQLDKLTATQLRELANEVSSPVSSKANKQEAIEAIERQVLLVKDMLNGART